MAVEQQMKIIEGQDPSVFQGDIKAQLINGWFLFGSVRVYFTQGQPDQPFYIATLTKTTNNEVG